MTKGYIPFSRIEPRLKREEKQVKYYIDKLGITLPQEEFVLKTILSQDWNRRNILAYIDKIKYENGLVQFEFTLTAPSRSVMYSCSNPYSETGWSKGHEDFYSRASTVHSYLSRYL